MLDTSKSKDYENVKKAIFMALTTHFHIEYIKEQKIFDPDEVAKLELSRQMSKLFIKSIDLEDIAIENLKLEIKSLVSKAIDTVLGDVFEYKGVPNATDPLSRH